MSKNRSLGQICRSQYKLGVNPCPGHISNTITPTATKMLLAQFLGHCCRHMAKVGHQVRRKVVVIIYQNALINFHVTCIILVAKLNSFCGTKPKQRLLGNEGCELDTSPFISTLFVLLLMNFEQFQMMMSFFTKEPLSYP